MPSAHICLLEEPEWPKHCLAVWLMVVSPITSTMEVINKTHFNLLPCKIMLDMI